MAIKDRIRAEARRTIDGIESFYKEFGGDSEEKEHRIARIEAAMEGCNGLTQEEKVQKTAENLFELTCAQERAFDSMRKEIKTLRDENNKEFDILRVEMRDGLKEIIKKIEESGSTNSGKTTSNTPSTPSTSNLHQRLILKLISDHPVITLNAFLFTLVLVFISGHFDDIMKACGVQM